MAVKLVRHAFSFNEEIAGFQYDRKRRHCERSEATQGTALDVPWVASSLRSSQ
jgi:hypothetical protein